MTLRNVRLNARETIGCTAAFFRTLCFTILRLCAAIEWINFEVFVFLVIASVTDVLIIVRISRSINTITYLLRSPLLTYLLTYLGQPLHVQNSNFTFSREHVPVR